MSTNEPSKKNQKSPPATPTEAVLGPKDFKSKRTARWEKHRKRLLALRSYLEAERRNRAVAAREPPEPFSMDMADAATDEFDRDLALSQLSAEQAALYEIDEALARIENGSYGICEITGEPIPEARLTALPWTRFSRNVERRLERQGETRRMRLGELHSATGRGHGTLSELDKGEETPEAAPNDELLFPHKYFYRTPNDT